MWRLPSLPLKATDAASISLMLSVTSASAPRLSLAWHLHLHSHCDAMLCFLVQLICPQSVEFVRPCAFVHVGIGLVIVGPGYRCCSLRALINFLCRTMHTLHTCSYMASITQLQQPVFNVAMRYKNQWNARLAENQQKTRNWHHLVTCEKKYSSTISGLFNFFAFHALPIKNNVLKQYDCHP